MVKELYPGLRVVDNISKPLILYCDNQPVVFYTSNNKSSGAAKHIDIKYHVVKDRIQDQTISVKHISKSQCLQICSLKAYHPISFVIILPAWGYWNTYDS